MKQFEKVEKLKTFANVTPPETKIFDFSKNEMLSWQKMGKVVNLVKLAIPSQSEFHFGGKRWENLQNDQNWPFPANLSHFFWQNLPLWVILSCFDVK